MQNNLNIQQSNFLAAGVLEHSNIVPETGCEPLGNRRKECATSQLNFKKKPVIKDDVSKRNQSFRLQKISAENLKGIQFPRRNNNDKNIGICSCCKNRNGLNKEIKLMYNSNTKKAFYANLFHCNSIWTCPVCARRISEFRRNELLTISEKWQSGDFFNYATKYDTGINFNESLFEKKNSIFLVTFTVRHNKSHSLNDVLFALKYNFRKLVRNGSGRRLLAKYGIAHNVKSLEVTYGDSNGWHPHYHVLFYGFYELKKEEMENFQHELSKLWMKGFSGDFLKFKPNLKNGVDVADGSYASTYINKFGQEVPCRRLGEKVDLEMTKSHMKKAKENDRFTPFEMLEYFNDLPHLKHKYIEYAQVFFGTMQLRYSKGLKNLMELVDLDDEQVLDVIEDKEEIESIGLFNVDKALMDILYINDLRGEFLAMIEIDIKNDGLFSNLKNTNRLIRTVIENVFLKLEIALKDEEDQNRIKRIEKRILSCVWFLQNPLILSRGQGDGIHCS